VHTLRCIVAEWQVVRARLVHTRLGIWLLLLSMLLLWASAGDASLHRVAARAGLLGGVLCVAFAAGAAVDREALRTTLGHPTTPFAVAAGRWLAATVAAGLPVVGIMLAAGIMHGAPPHLVFAAGLTGVLAAASLAAVTLPAVLAGGNTMAVVLFLYLLAAGVTTVPAWPTRPLTAALYASAAAGSGMLASVVLLSRRA
jgi:hypothetical protein